MRIIIIAILIFASSVFPKIVQAQEIPAGTIKGRLVDKGTKQTIPGGTVMLKGTPNGAVTDTSGMFVIAKVAEGTYQLVASFAGYQEKTITDVNVARGKTNYIEIELETPAVSLKEVSITSYKYENSPLTPVSTYGFSREEISRNPGAQGDIFRAIGMLPGVTSSGGQYSAIAVRGQGTRDNIYMVDDIPITEVGHLEGNGSFNDPNGGRFSIFAPRVIDNAQFQGGGIAAQYGRRSASFLGLGIKEGNKEDYTIDGQLDLLGFTLNYDGPSHLHKNTSIFVSARYQDFREVIKVVGLKGIGLPRYGDLVFKSATQLGKKNKLSLIAIVSPDDYVRSLTDIRDQTEVSDALLLHSSNQKYIFGLNLRTLTSKNSYWKNVLYYTRTHTEVERGTSFLRIDTSGNITNKETLPTENDLSVIRYSEAKVGYRSIYTVNFQNRSKLVAGIDLDRTQLNNYRHLSRMDTSYIFDATDHRPDPGQFYTIVDPRYFNADVNDAQFNASAYADYSFLLLKKLAINAGLRYDYNGFADQHTVSPRISGNYQLNETNSINFAAGVYFQDPVYSEVADQPKDKKLKEEQVNNVILGYKKQFSPDLKLIVEGWYKSFDNMVVRPNRSYSEQTNTGTGWASGIDMNITKRLARKVHGQVGYSYMQSRRDDHDGLGEYDFAFSQPNQFNCLVSYAPGKHWILAAKFRYATGKPTNSYVLHTNIFNVADNIRYSQEITGKNNIRVKDFISLDVRADYRFQVKALRLTAFIDVVDVMNRFNESALYLSPYTGKIVRDGLAIFPSFGLKFEY